MDNSALIQEAQSWANHLLLKESRGPGDMDNAIRRVSARYGLDHGTLWGLRYRPPKRMFVDVYFRLRAAYQAERERQLRLLQHETTITKVAAGADNNSVRAAEAVLDAAADEIPPPPLDDEGRA